MPIAPKLAEMLLRFNAVGCMGLFLCVEWSKKNIPTFDNYPTEKPIAGLFNSLQSDLVPLWNDAISQVLLACGFAQVGPTVVRSVPVAMVDKLDRISAGHQFPNQSVDRKPFTVQREHTIVLPRITKPGWLASASGGPSPVVCFVVEMLNRPIAPSQFPGFRVICKALAEILLIGQDTVIHIGLSNRRLVRSGWALASLAASLLYLMARPAQALAADEPPTISMPSSEIAHVVQLLRYGGTRAEQDALADQLVRSAQSEMAKQQAPKPAAPAEPPK